MVTNPSGSTRPVVATALGLAAALVVLAAWRIGVGDVAELHALDWRFRNFSSAAPCLGVAHVDIDDNSLEQLGRWPWPRSVLAGIVSVLDECGAEVIALDVILPEPQETRFVSDAWSLYAGRDGELLGAGRPLPVFDDAELSRTINEAGNVVAALHLDFEHPHATGLESLLTVLLDERPETSLDEARAAAADAALSPPDEETLVKAYLRARALASLRRFTTPRDRVDRYPLRAARAVPPLAPFARAIRGAGFVTVEPDSDGVVRRIALLGESTSGHVYSQLALRLAAGRLERVWNGPVTLRADADAVVLEGRDDRRRIPISDAGRMFINWRCDEEGEGPPHVSAAFVGGIHEAREMLDRNARRERLLQLRLAARLGQSDILDAAKRADELYARREELRFDLNRAMLFDPDAAPGVRERIASVRAAEQEAEETIERLVPELFDDFYIQGLAENDPRRAEVLDLRRQLREDIPAANEALRDRIAEATARLRPIVEGRTCLIGSTATGAADFVPTPLGERTPGVVTHTHILNTIVSGRFVTQAHPAVDALVILAMGAAVAALTATRAVWLAGPLTLVLCGVYGLFNAAVAFGAWRVWLTLLAPLAAAGASFAVTTAYRQLTEERAKRHIRSMFAHAISPALVDRLLSDPSLARLGGERREVTCYFSDLAGFTSLSERLGEQRTVAVLNRYFDRMSDVIQHRRGGYLNKFLGDGLLVFFGAPVFQDDHPARAVRAALDSHAEIADLNAVLGEELNLPVRLSARVGLATGEVMVGNCGSSDRMDYTAIGDTVNLASRLEGANKFFHTGVLAAEATWRKAEADLDGQIVARPLGRIVVVGRDEPVAVWNPMCPADEPDAKTCRNVASAFAEGLTHFQAGRFHEAGECFRGVLADAPDDGPATVYIDLCRRYAEDPPGEDWNGVVRLTEK